MIRIKSIEFFNHKIFGNKKFDFTINGNSVNNVIIAGENGVGKTKLLEELNNISTKVFNSYNLNYPTKLQEVVIDLSDEKYCNFNNEMQLIDEAVLTTFKNGSGFSYIIKFKSNGTYIENVKHKEINDKVERFNLNFLYSPVDINYKPRTAIKGITNKTIDNSSNSIPDDLASEIIQLFVDIASQDSNDLDSWIGKNRDKVVPENIYHTRLKRFTNAFELMFNGTIKYKGIKNNTIPIFEKDNKEIEISSLSSGEKQIIFRGVYLLRNKNSLKGIPVLIDEPELSMHPKWEEKIFDYYKNIFSINSTQTSQIFIATHSEHILDKALKESDCLVIKIKENSFDKFYKDGPGIILPTITLAEIKYAIFDLYTTDYHSLLYGFIQENYVKDINGNIINNPNVKQTDDWLKTKNVTLKHYRKQLSQNDVKEYDTLPTYIRNCIDHPDSSIIYSESELKLSINNLISVIQNPN